MRRQGILPEDVLNATDRYPGEFLWGYRPLCDLFGHNQIGILYAAAGQTSKNILFRMLAAMATKFLVDMKIDLSLAFQLWRQRRKTEAVFVAANNAVFTALALRILGCGFRVYPLLLGWPEFKFSQMNRLKRSIWMFLLQKADGVLALGIEEAKELRLHGLRNVQFLTFGVDTDFWAPVNGMGKNFIFSVGADPNRDFETLLAANIDSPIVLCTPQERVKCLSIPQNVSVVQGSYSDVRKWFHEAKVVVIPIMDTIRPSGQGCILQAMSTGKAVITTSTQGRWTDKLIDGENCILVPPADPDALRQAIAKVYNDSALSAKIGHNARKTVLEHFTLSHFARSLAAVTGVNDQIDSSPVIRGWRNNA